MTWTIGQRTFHLGRRPSALGPVVIAVLAALLVAGTVVALVRSGLGDRSDDTASMGAPTVTANKVARDRSASTPSTTVVASGASGASAAGSVGAAELDAGPVTPSAVPALRAKIVRTADLRIRVRGSFSAAIDHATTVATLFGGFVTSSSTSSLEKGAASAELTLRVPADRFDDARRRLVQLGKLESLQMSGHDVSGQLVDLDARLRAARAEEGALTALLSKAADVGQILQVRDRVAAVRTEIEQLDGEQAALRDQVTMSTISVSLHQAGTPATAHVRRHGRDATSIGNSARTAFHAAEAVLGGMLIVLGALVPLLALALLGLLTWWLAARRRTHSAV